MDRISLLQQLETLESELPRKDLDGENVWDYSKSDIEVILWNITTNDQNQLLLLKRSNTVSFPEKWSVVSGVYDAVVSPEELAQKEILEELNIKVSIENIELKEIMEASTDTRKYIVVITTTQINDDEKIELNNENTEFKWIQRNELNQFDMIPQVQDYLEHFES